jgi:hypothetical protein
MAARLRPAQPSVKHGVGTSVDSGFIPLGRGEFGCGKQGKQGLASDWENTIEFQGR